MANAQSEHLATFRYSGFRLGHIDGMNTQIFLVKHLTQRISFNQDLNFAKLKLDINFELKENQLEALLSIYSGTIK